MHFINPSFLWALVALAIPVLIHLFYFRRYKKVYFTNVRFLKEVKEEQSIRKKLRNLLVLLSRLLALACLVIAFAQPFIPKSDKVDLTNKEVSIFIDNSFSMNALSEEVALIDLAKLKASEIVNAYSDEDRFQILSHELGGSQQRLLTKDDALAAIENLKSSSKVNALSKIINRQKQIIGKESRTPSIFLISDFQQSITDLESYKDTSINVNLIPLRSVQEKNVSIDSVWFESGIPALESNNKMLVKISNHANEKAENVRLSFLYENQNKPVGVININPRSSIIDTVNVKISRPGIQFLEFKISDYPVSFDDSYYASFEVKEKIEILSIYGDNQNSFLAAAFNGLPHHSLEQSASNRIDYSKFSEKSLIILNDLNIISSGLANKLSEYVLAGGNLLVFPGKNVDIDNFNAFSSILALDKIQSSFADEKKVRTLNESDFVFKEVFLDTRNNIKLPTASFGYNFTRFQNRGRSSIIDFRDGQAYLSKYSKGSGQVYLCASPLDKEVNDLAQNAEVFIPLLYKSSLSGKNTDQLAYTIGKEEIVSLRRDASKADLRYSISGDIEFIPSQTRIKNNVLLDMKGQIEEHGFYDLNLENKKIKSLAFNYDRRESDLSYADLGELANNKSIVVFDNTLSANLTDVIAQKEKGIVLWRLFLILCLVFIGIESLLLRFWKV